MADAEKTTRIYRNRMSLLNIIVIIAYLSGLLLLGFSVSFKNKQKRATDLFLAGKSLTWPTIGLSIFGTNVSPLNILSTAGLSFTYGMVACNFTWLAWMYLLLLSVVFLPYYIKHDIQTMPQFMLRRYDERCRKVLSWVVFFQISIGAACVLYAGCILISELIHLPIYQCVIIMSIFSVSFTITGGLKAVVYTDSLQAIIMVGVCCVIVFIGLHRLSDWSSFKQIVDKDYWRLLRSGTDKMYPWQAIILGYPVMSIWYWCANQNIVQNTLASKSLREGQKGLLFVSFLKLLIPLLFIIPGILCRITVPNLSNPDDAFLKVIYEYLPPGLVGLAIAVLIAALVSTLTAMYNSASTIFSLDIMPVIRKRSNNLTVSEGRLVIAGIAFLTSVIAVSLSLVTGLNLFEKVNSLMSFLCPSLSVVFIWGVFWKRITERAAYYTLLFGNIPTIIISVCYLSHFPSATFWPNFFMISFYLFVGLSIILIALSFLLPKGETDLKKSRPIYNWREYRLAGTSLSRPLWLLWGGLGIIMIGLYVYFK